MMSRSRSLLILALSILIVWGWLLIFPLAPLPVEWMEAEVQSRSVDAERRAAGLRVVVSWQPWRAQAWEDLAQAELAQGNEAAAVQALERQAALRPLRMDQQMQLAQLYLHLGRGEQAQRLLRTAVEQVGLDEQTLFTLAQMQRSAADLEGTAQTLERCLALPQPTAVVRYQAGLFQALRNPSAARGLWQALSQEPAYAAAAQTMVDALQMAAGSADPAYRMVTIGRALGSLGEWDVAAWAFSQAVQQSPDYAEAWALLAQAQQALGQDGGPALQRALALQPDAVLVQAAAAVYWLDTGQTQQALAVWQALSERQPLVCLWWAEQGRAYAQQGDLANALAFYQQAVQVQPQDVGCWQRLARFSLTYGLDVPGVGLPAARQVLALRPDDPMALLLMGQMLMVQGDAINAERFLRRSLAEAESDAAHLALGQLLLTLPGRAAEAQQHLQAAADWRPGSVSGDRARSLLEEHFR